MVRGPRVELKTDSTLHRQGDKAPFTPNYLCIPHPQISDTLHIFTKIYIKNWVFNPKTNLGDAIPTCSNIVKCRSYRCFPTLYPRGKYDSIYITV